MFTTHAGHDLRSAAEIKKSVDNVHLLGEFNGCSLASVAVPADPRPGLG
jgi:hypothetical protein